MKARMCLQGNFLMRQYCKEKGLSVLENGKVIVTRNEAEIPALEELYRRAKANGAKVEMIDGKTLEKIEPNARTTGKALFSHYTAQIDPKAVLKSLRKELEATGIDAVFAIRGYRFSSSGHS